MEQPSTVRDLEEQHAPDSSCGFNDLLGGGLKVVIGEWKKRACKYFCLAKEEKDPLGRKFYESAAMAYANCVMDVNAIAASRIPTDEYSPEAGS